jgi:iron complex transport system substrate-binding protein
LFIILIVIFDWNSKSTLHQSVETKYIPNKVISLSPSITETLFALNLGNKVIGRTRFCNYPSEALAISEVGGYLDLNFERIIALNPDMVLLLPEHEKAKQYLRELNIPVLEVNNKTVEDILQTISTIGKRFGVEDKSNYFVDSLAAQLNSILEISENLAKPRTLISIGREIGVGTIKDLYIAGLNTYFDELINIAGGKNILQDESIAYPTISAEGLIYLDPEVIIDLINPAISKSTTTDNILKDWDSLSGIQAVANNNITVLDSKYISIPGPRFIILLQDIAKAIHPEIDWKF